MKDDQMTSAESRTLREWLGLTASDIADLSGMSGQSVRRSEAGKIRVRGRVAAHPTAVATLRQVDQVTARAAETIGPVLFRDQADYDDAQPQPALGDYRLHNTAALRRAVDVRAAGSVTWAWPGRAHDDASICAMRRRTGTTLDWVANQLEIHVNKLRRIELGDEPVPSEVRDFLAALVDDMATYRDLLLNDAAAGDGPAVFVRFRSDTDLEDTSDDAGLELPAATHALATWDAIDRLRAAGHATGLIWLNTSEYHNWLADKPDTRSRRNQWATGEWTANRRA